MSEIRRNWPPGLAAPVELVVHLSVPEEQHPSSVAGRLYQEWVTIKMDLPGAVQFSKQLQQGIGGPGVQSAGGFVCQNQLGVRG